MGEPGDNLLELVAVVEEGSCTALWAQLRHTGEIAELDTVTLHVLPSAIGAHAALASGFTTLHSGPVGEPDIAYVEHALGAVTLDKGSDVAQAKRNFESVLTDSLDPCESLALIRQPARE